MAITQVNIGSVILKDAISKDDVLTFAGADTFAAGTILARSTATDKLVLFVKGGAVAGNGIPKAVLTYDVSATGAGDVNVRAMVSGEVRKELLIIDADGDDSNIDAVVLDQLRAYGIVASNVKELNIPDNS